MKKQLLFRSAIAIVMANFCISLFSNLQAQTISTFAGGSLGDGKPASSIGIGEVGSMKTDTSGNLYMLVNKHIRRVDQLTGIITTIAGGGTISYDDNTPVAEADLQDAKSITIDRQNNLYVAYGNSISRLDETAGELVRIAGVGYGSLGDGGPALNASFTAISAITTDIAGNLYICDGNYIRKISASTGIIETVAGNGLLSNSGDNGPALSAGFSAMKAIIVDHHDDIFVITFNNTVRKIETTSGIVTRYAGTGTASYSGDGGAATAAGLAQPSGLAVNYAGDLYITDFIRLRKVTAATGVITTVAGSFTQATSGDGGIASSATFSFARMLAIDAHSNIYVEDNSGAVRMINNSTGIINRWAGNYTNNSSGVGGPKEDLQLNAPRNTVMDKSGNIYIADEANARIYKIDNTGQVINFAGNGEKNSNVDNGLPAATSGIGVPFALAADTSGNIFYVDYDLYIRKIDTDGILSTVAGNGNYEFSGDGGPAELAGFNSIQGLAIDKQNNIYISDQGNHRIRKIDAATGIISTIAGTGENPYNPGDVLAADAALSYPGAIVTDDAGNIYFNDGGNFIIRKIDALSGEISTVAGNNTPDYSGDGGPATDASLVNTSGLAIDKNNILYISDVEVSVIRRVDLNTNTITHIAGTPYTLGFAGDGAPAATSMLNAPGSVIVDTSNHLLVADTENGRIRIIDLTIIPPPIPKPVMSGRIFYDLNSDGVQNPGEQYADGITVALVQDTIEKRMLSDNGGFRLLPDTGSLSVSLRGIENYVVYPASFTGYSYEGYLGDSIVFALQPKANHYDLSVNIVPLTPVRAGTKTTYLLEYKNEGSVAAVNTKLSFIKSGKLSVVATIPAYSSVSGDTLTWNLNTLAPATAGSIRIETLLAPPPVATIYDSLYSKAIITQTNTDVRPYNDTLKLRQLVTGPYDPNDKTETHGGYLAPQQIANGEYLNYVIRFQNTGNDTAFNVVIRDTLPATLDAATVEMTGSSDGYLLSITDNKLTWQFEDIRLPDSNTNEKKSHGYISFRVRPMNTVTSGTTIENTSSIYFDFNPPIRTNTARTLVRTLPSAPPKPTVAFNPAGYCGASILEKVKIENLNSAYKAKVIVGTAVMPIGADSIFNISPQLIPPGTYNILTQYINESGESSLLSTVTIIKPATPKTTVTTNKSVITSLPGAAVIIAANTAGGGTIPRYTFAKDRGFTSLIQNESTSAVLNLNAEMMQNGDNWIYVRMKTNEVCTTTATAIDSIKITKNILTTSVIDIDNPGTAITGFPNPFSNQLTVTGLMPQKSYNISIYDARGVLINVLRVSNKRSHTITTLFPGKGTYWITIKDAGKNRLIGTLKAIHD
jgi:uncharacterized repeat protein (TIGR01451 family)